tara:strand:+ start:6845 stop:8329 length:1485 start_codon:yes stop_codon:yes gene_type:complete
MFFRKTTLTQQILFSTILLISSSLCIFAWVNISQIKKDTINYNYERLARKDRAVTKSVEALIDFNLPIDLAFSQKLKEISLIHKIRLNVYDLEGNFLLASDSLLQNDTIITSKIGQDIINSIDSQTNKRIEYEKGVYFGTYRIIFKPKSPFITDDQPALSNTPYCILHVVYDKSTKDDILNKTNQQIKKLIRIYFLLLLLGIFSTVFLLNQITTRLRSITKYLKGAHNTTNLKPLSWPVDDEIGQLVQAYNSLIKQLDITTKQLIRSEKEGAWKKMAKQIAHEIKNPLTPMRLNVQYLEKSFKDGKGRKLYSDDWEEKLFSFSKTMIQQIDTLTRVANAFSDFASLNKQSLEKICLVSEVERIVNLFKKNNVKLKYDKKLNSMSIMIDKTHLTRVLNNLINNSLQSAKAIEPIIVEVNLKSQKKYHIISVSDNGIGIPPDIQNKIFEPTFTTKNSGTGLGLAMVKKIVDDSKGKISYITSKNGTTFNIMLPIKN